jgi:hypothetical protein
MKHSSEVTVLTPAGREEQLERWGLSASHRWGEAGRTPHHADDSADNADDDTSDDTGSASDFLAAGGWSPVDVSRGRAGRGMTHLEGGARDAGMSTHRGVFHPDEHVDADALRSAVERGLGFTYDDVRAVYRQGRKSDAQLELRGRIDARLLEIESEGGNLAELARAIGLNVRPDEGDCPAFKHALQRARKEATP